MFEQLKQLKKIQEIQSALKKETAECEKEGVRVVVNGKLEVESITLNPDLDNDRHEKIVKECLNEAMKKIQMVAAQKMQSMGGFGM